jgi:nucleoid DNA-binding protein
MSIVRRLKSMGLTQREAEEADETLINGIIRGLEKDGKVLISGFGRFVVRRRRPGSVRLPGRERQKIPARMAVRFKASPKLFQHMLKLEHPRPRGQMFMNSDPASPDFAATKSLKI